MDFKRFLALSGITSSFLLISNPSDFAYAKSDRSIQVLASQPSSRPSAERDTELKYKLIGEYAINEFLREYLENVKDKSPKFKRNISKAGSIDKFLPIYAENHFLLLNAVRDHKTSKEDFDNYSRIISKNMAKQGGYVNYRHDAVVSQLRRWAENRAQFFQQLINAPLSSSDGEKGFREIVRGAYTKESLEEWVNRQHKENEDLYDRMYDTLGIVQKAIGGSDIAVIREETRKAYDSIIIWVGKNDPK